MIDICISILVYTTNREREIYKLLFLILILPYKIFFAYLVPSIKEIALLHT